ncbi:MAG: tetratricopeptide repeat protein [Phycisphaerae bacterium]
MNPLCREWQSQIEAFVTGTLSTPRTDSLNQHLNNCDSCRKYLENLRDDHNHLTEFSNITNTTISRLEQNVLAAIAQVPMEQPSNTISIWRKIMKNRITKLATAAALILAVFYGLNLITWPAKGHNTAWAVEQTIQALKNVDTLYISGTINDGSPFKFWIKRNKEKEGFFKLRYESKDEVVVVQDTKIYAYSPQTNQLQILDKGQINNHWPLKFWFIMGELKLWTSGTIFQKMKQNATDWTETYGKDETTGRDCVFVTGSYASMSQYLWLEFDLGTKLVVRTKVWQNTKREGMPELNSDNFVYNQEIPDTRFDFEIPPGANINAGENSPEAKAQKLFEEGKYQEALLAYQEAYKKAPPAGMLQASMLSNMGQCYVSLGQQEKAKEIFQKAIREYRDPEVLGISYYNLGYLYSDLHQKDKALEAFRNCIQTVKGICGPNGFPIKNAREMMERLEKEGNDYPLKEKAMNLFEKENYQDALAVSLEIYKKTANPMNAAEALIWIGFCYEHLNQTEKAIEYYEKSIREYPQENLTPNWFYLGKVYQKTHQKEKALNAFKNCLRAGKTLPPEVFPLKDAREMIKKLESESSRP